MTGGGGGAFFQKFWQKYQLTGKVAVTVTVVREPSSFGQCRKSWLRSAMSLLENNQWGKGKIFFFSRPAWKLFLVKLPLKWERENEESAYILFRINPSPVL